MAENFPQEKSEQGEKDRTNKLSRIQSMLANLLKRGRNLDYEFTEDDLSAKSSIQFVSSSAIFATQLSDDDED